MNTRWMHRPVASDAAVIRFCQLASFAAAALVPAIAFQKLTLMELSLPYSRAVVAAAMGAALLYTALGWLLGRRLRTAARS